MTILFIPCFVLAVIGLVLSLIAHGAAVLGLPQPLAEAAWGLHAGAVVLLLPAFLASRRLGADPKQKDFWQKSLRGCPRWARWLTAGFFGYAVVNLLLTLFLDPPGKTGGGPPPPGLFRAFSGHWMAFYSFEAAILYSALVVGRVGDVARALADRFAGAPGGAQAADYDEPAAPRDSREEVGP